MSQLLCPRCKDGGNLEWEKPEDIDLEAGIIVCRTCRSRYQGIPGWTTATKKESLKKHQEGADLMTCLSIFLNDHPRGACGTGPDGRWLLQDCEGKTVGYGSGMLNAAQRYVHFRYGQGPIRRTLP